MDNLNKKNYFESTKYILLASFITAFILILTFMACGFAPFGENSILRVDLYHQYAPFHEELRNKLLNGESLFYSFEGGLGKNFLAQMAYYTFSPFSILILFFKANYLPEAILLFVFLKIVCCALFFAIYLKKAFNKNDLSIVIFAIMYAFIAYITSFYWNIMWLDSIFLFPLVALGLERLVKQNGYKTYFFALLLSILVNFYIAFLVCIFATLYFLIILFSHYSIKEEYKAIFKKIGKFLIISLIAGGITMFLAIPTLIAISNTATSDTTFPKFSIYQNIYQIITNHFSGANPIILARNEDLPNVYSGVLTILLLPTYFFNKEIKTKEKILFALLIIFMLLCSIIKPLDFLIHGGHFPANLPHRYTFIYSFILLILGFKAFKYIKSLNLKAFSIFSIIYICIILFTEYLLVPKIASIDRVLSNYDILANIFFILVYNIILYLYKKFDEKEEKNFVKYKKVFNLLFSLFVLALLILAFGISVYSAFGEELLSNDFTYFIQNFSSILKYLIPLIILIILLSIFIYYTVYVYKKQNIILFVLLAVVFFECTTNSLNGFLYNGGTLKNTYVKYIDDTQELLAYLEENDTDENKFYRQEFRRFTAINEGSLYHYNGFSQFSSLAYGNTSELMQRLGIASTSNSFRYYDPTPLINAIFNVKYIMNKDSAIPDDTNLDYTFVKDFGSVYLYKNEKALSLGFMVNSDIKDWEVDENSPFVAQNDFVKKATGIEEDLTIPIEDITFSFENIDVTQDSTVETKYSYTLTNENSLEDIPTVYATITNTKEQRVFLYVDAANASRFKYTINGQTQDREISTGRSLIDLGIVPANTEIYVEFSLNRKGTHEKTYRTSGTFKLLAASFEEDVFEKAYDYLETQMLVVNNYTSDTIEGTINVLEDGTLFTSIPYDSGFKVFVDGEEVQTNKIANDGLLSIDLTKGEHNIIFKYTVPGFKLGLCISIVSIIAFIIFIFLNKKYQKINVEK